MTDTLAEIPESDVPRPERLAGPFAELLERVHANLEGQPPVEDTPIGEAWIVHGEFEAKMGYSCPSECTGMLRFEDQSESLWPAICDGCGFEVVVNMDRLDPNRMLEQRLERAGIPSEFAGKKFEADEAQEPTLKACRLWLRGFRATHLADSVPAVALFGKPGRGKSHLLALMVDTLIRNHTVDVMYRSATQLFDELRAGVQEGSYEVRWQRVLHVPVLALDDLGAGRWTEWQADRFEELVDRRYSRGLPLLVATNIPPAGWDAKFGPRAASRLRGICLRFELAGQDRRVAQQASLLGAPA